MGLIGHGFVQKRFVSERAFGTVLSRGTRGHSQGGWEEGARNRAAVQNHEPGCGQKAPW